VSEDARLFKGLCLAAAENSLSLVQAHSLSEAIEQAHRPQLAASLLDLDMSSDAVWQVAELLVGHGTGVPVLMVTARTEDQELSAAMRCGVVLEKSIGAERLMRAAVVMLEEPAQRVDGRLALQQAWLQRGRPYRWEDAGARGCEHWGIND
jgi:DNA-binding response OmpR family regulator